MTEQTIMKDEVVILDAAKPERLARLTPFLPDRFTLSAAASLDPADRLTAIRRARYAITGDVAVSGEMMRAGAEAGLVAVHKWGVGYDNIDIETARAVGVRVLRTTGSNAVQVAETTLGLMLALQRSLLRGHLGMLDGHWGKGDIGPTTFMLTGRTIGLVGLGPIGQQVARFLVPFGCRVLYTKPTPLAQEDEQALGVTHVPLDTLLAEADIVSLHCALTDSTRRLIDARALSLMKDGAVLVNTARGGIADERAVADALDTGKLRAAAFDVFETEPLPPGSPLVGRRNVIVTPHIASQGAEGFPKTVARMFRNLELLAEGKLPPEQDIVV